MFQRIHITDFHQVWKSNDNGQACCIIDVRTPEEYAQARVPNAKLLPLDTLAGRQHEIPKDCDVYLICRSGGRSAQAAQYLAQQHGHDRLVNIEGGTMAWIEAGHPIER